VYLALTFTGTAFSVNVSYPNPFGRNLMASATIGLKSIQASFQADCDSMLSFKGEMNEETLASSLPN